MNLNSRSLEISAGCLLSLVAILYAISNALPSWSSADMKSVMSENIGTGSIISGLWKQCISGLNEDVCGPLSCWGARSTSNDCQRLAAGHLLIWSCVLAALTGIYFFINTFKKEYELSRYLLIVKIVVGVSFLLGLIGVTMGIIYTSYSNTLFNVSMELAAYIAIVALVLNFAAVVISMLIR